MSAFPSSTVLEKSGFFTQPWRMFLLDIYNKTGGPAGLIYASSITFIPSGDIFSTNVQSGMEELDDKKVPITRSVNGHPLSADVTVTKADVGLGNVTNDIQTKASVVPNTLPSAGQLLVGSSGFYAPVSMSGDAAFTSSGLLTIAANSVSYAKMQNASAASVLIGRGQGSGAGVLQELTLGSGVAMSGTVLSATGSGGTVTTVSVVSANGFAGSVANPTTTPAITLTTTITGLLKGNGTAISASVVTDDVQTKAAVVPNTLPASGQMLVGNAGGTAYAPVAASGAVTLASTGAFTLATPGTLTVATSNSNVTAHTHAITSSSAPGAAASILATDASGIVGSTGTRIVKLWAVDITCTNSIAASVTGSAATLTTPRNINGVAFDGSANITVAAAAGTLTGATLASGVTASSLTSVGTLTSLAVSTGGSSNAITTTTNGSSAAIQVNDSGVATGAVIAMTGDGVTTPSKRMRVKAGKWEIVNDANTTAILSLTDAGALAATGAVTGSNLSGTNTGDQTITLTGDVTGSGTGSFAATIASAAVTYAKIQNISATSRILGRITAGAGSTEELTAANVKTILALTSSDVGLGNVTNDAQTKAAIVPNTAPAAGQILVGNAGGTAYAAVAASGAFTLASTGAATIATPGTLTVSTSNSTATAHTHAITSSSAPGAAASLLATDSSGILGSTGTRIVKIWAIDLTVTNSIAGSITGNAATVTTNANLTGVITSSGNATSIASQTGTGTKFVVDNTPTLITPVIGAATGTSLAATGAITSSGGGVGYATGAGGTVTQTVSKGQGVTLAKLSGDITLNNAALAGGANTSFIFSNSLVAAGDTIVMWHNSGGTSWAYDIKLQVVSGGATVNIKNNTAGSLSEAAVLRFVVIKSVTA